MIIRKNGNLKELEFYEFLVPGSFLTIANNNELYIVIRNVDKNNISTNVGFGVKGFQCPTSIFVFNVINNIIENIKKFNIEIMGEIKYDKSKRFQKNILNKKDISFKFNYEE